MTNELEREILRVLEANDYGLSVYANPGADGISRAEIMDSLPTSIGPAGELAAEEVARTMDLSREEQEAEMRAQVPALKGAATGAAVATATTIPDIIGLGYGGVKALLAKEGEKGQAFLDGLSSISGTVGSEKAGKIYAEYVGDLDATDEEKAAMMVGYQAGEFGGIPGLAGAYQLVKKGAKAAPDFIESAGEAAKARMEGGTTLSSGVNPDAAIAAAGDAIAKFRAPTEKEPGIIAFHGSGADFDEFKLEKIGTGEGAQAYGYGLYFTDSESIARFYRDAVSAGQTKIPYDGAEDAAQAIPDNIPYLDVDGYRSYLMGDAEEVITNILTKQYFNTKPEQRIIDANLDVLEKNGAVNIKMRDGSFVTLLKNQSGDQFTATPLKEKTGKMYKVGLEPKPEDMLDYQGTFADQPKNVQDALKAIGYEVETDRTGLKNPPMKVSAAMNMPMPVVLQNMKKVVSDAEKAPFDTEIVKINDRMNVLAKTMDKYEISYRKYSDPKGQEAADEYDSLMDKRQELVNQMADTERSDKLLARKLSEQGVPGIKYRAAGSRAASVDAADAEMNYVIFDDKMIKILEKYGIVGPVAITGVAASQQEGESDGRSA